MRKATVVFLVPLLVPLGGCTVWGPEGGPGGHGRARPSSSAAPESVTDAIVGADGVQRVTVTADDRLRFSPSAVRARTGTIEFTIRNAGGAPHAFGVGSARVDNLNGGETATVRVTVNKPGEYPYPCVYHASSGMQGTLEVR